jgi:hypothetical protein
VFERHTCPRRAETFGREADKQDKDVWETGHGLSGQDDVGLSCSFCGSLNPARFLELAGQGWWVDPTDKSYKAYLARPLTDGEVADAKRRWLAGSFATTIREAVAEQDADAGGSVDAVIEREWQQMPAAGGHGAVVAKVYFQHLDEAQRDEFLRLVNDRVMRIGIPGYFYVTPFFAVPRTATGGDGASATS